MIRALIVDDEPLGRRRIRDLLEAEPDLAIVGECANGEEALREIERGDPDLVFLDVQMPGVDGFGVVAGLQPAHRPLIVFVTAYDEYALRAFDAAAIDYLLKPFDDERFRESLARARASLAGSARRSEGEALQRLLRSLGPEPAFAARLVVRSGPKNIFVRTADLDWISADGKYVRLHTGGRSHLVRDTLTSLLSRLDPRVFCRIHRSMAVNVERIREIETYSREEYVVVLHDGTRLTSGRSYRGAIQVLLGR
jgi:two-component system, LytTR family, response regulator